MNVKTVSPMMEQWQRCKREAKGALLLFRCGDFFEAFYEDAKLLSKTLDLTLTKRQEIPMAGVPVQALEASLEKLLNRGLIVAIADQVEDPKEAKGLVQREITQIVSPATYRNFPLNTSKSNNFFASIFQVNQTIGLCFLDLSTGEMLALEVENKADFIAQIAKRCPTEILLSDKFYQSNRSLFDDLKQSLGFIINLKEEWHFNHKHATDVLKDHFKIASLDAFGLKGMVSAINACGGLLIYLIADLLIDLASIKAIEKVDLASALSIDYTTSSSLDLFKSTSSHKAATLFDTLDRTSTPMGSRLLKRWLIHPLIDVDTICQRQDSIEEMIALRLDLTDSLSQIRDLDRLTMRITANLAGPRDLRALAESLKQVPLLFSKTRGLTSSLMKEIHQKQFDFSELAQKIDRAIVLEPPLRFTEGGIFKRGYMQELDELKQMNETSLSYLANYQTALRESLDIKTLRVSFSRAFGYTIEVSKGQAHKVPTSFTRRQTLVNAERFISPELKEYEEKILGAEERIVELEKEGFIRLRDEVASYATHLSALSHQIALIDVIFSLATVAKEKHYVKPSISYGDRIEIKHGRHPVIENFLPNETFIPNDTLLDNQTERLILLTGPNMAGKSTYIRQVALIVIMAQLGSFVPAKSASIGIVDKIFSRIGASDDLARGQSTFMVEMIETANILHNATSRSLVILDEIGRGTSTYDGISIALSVAEHLLEVIGAKTLFATHYFELTKLEEQKTGVKNYQVAVQENEDGIVFLHKILPGMADKSYGIHVASLAGLPQRVIQQAEKHLALLEKGKPPKKIAGKTPQIGLFDKREEPSLLERELRKVNVDQLTPLQALQLLADWKKKLG